MIASSASPSSDGTTRRRATVNGPVRVALVGCGAVSRENLLPVLAGHAGIVLGPLIDRDEARARALADAYGITSVSTDLDRLDRHQVDGVILATPPNHHAPATIACAAKGLHVLVEKPMALTAADARAMAEACDRAGVALSVGLYRRLLPAVQLLRTLIAQQEFGRPLSVDAEEGGPYGWQLATLDVLRRSSGGGGVLIDIGSHVIDVILYALDATPVLDRYEDNDRGGIETDSVLHATLQTITGAVPLRLELSRTRELRGTIRVVCEHATLELVRANFTEILIHRHGQTPGAPVAFTARRTDVGDVSGYEAFRREIDDWVTAMTTGADPVLSGRSVVPVVGLIEDVYRQRTSLIEPASDEALGRVPAPRSTSPKKRVLVTGAGGFLGGRAIEMLRDHYGWDAVPLIREPRSAARLARTAEDIRLGDVCTRADMDRVMRDCDAVVHCAVGTSWQPDETRRVTVDGTRVAAEAALAAGVTRFVHVSTMNVHERTGGGTLDETTPLTPPADDSYGQAKLEAERALASVAAKGLSTIVIRPTRIYGPFSRTFTISPLRALTHGRLAIGGAPDVPANMVYVDNVVAAIARALEAPASNSGAAFLISDADQLTLQQFYNFFGESIGAHVRVVATPTGGATPSRRGLVTQWMDGAKTIATSSELRSLVRRVLATDPIGTLPRRLWERSPAMQGTLLRRFGADAAIVYRGQPPVSDAPLVYTGEPARVVIEKAQAMLGYREAVDRTEAMRRTLEWARYARVLGDATVDVSTR